MEKFLFSLVFIYSIITPIFPTTHFESPQRFLHVSDENVASRPIVIENTNLDYQEVISRRYRRDLSSSINENLKNISTKVNTQTKFFFALISLRLPKRGEASLCAVSINSWRLRQFLRSSGASRNFRSRQLDLIFVMLAHGSWRRESSVWKQDENEERKNVNVEKKRFLWAAPSSTTTQRWKVNELLISLLVPLRVQSCHPHTPASREMARRKINLRRMMRLTWFNAFSLLHSLLDFD